MRVANISTSRVADDFLFSNIPVIVTDAMDDWEALKMFHLNFLTEVIILIFYLANVQEFYFSLVIFLVYAFSLFLFCQGYYFTLGLADISILFLTILLMEVILPTKITDSFCVKIHGQY